MTFDTITARSRRVVLGAALASLIATVALTVPAAAGGPTTRYVDDDDPGCGSPRYGTVQRAINNSNDGDTILVCPGRYVGDFEIIGELGHPDDLTIRAVDPWTADIVAPRDIDGGSVIDVEGVSGTVIQWLEVVARTTEPCDEVGRMISVFEAPDTRIRANHLQPRGTDTLSDCAYLHGIDVSSSDGLVIAWNRIIDFRFGGIRIDFGDDVDIHGNSFRYLHAAQDETVSLNGTGILTNQVGHLRIARNVARSLPTAGETTPQLEQGIAVLGSIDPRVIGNRVSYAYRGLTMEFENGGVVRKNAIRHSRSAGIEAFNLQGVRFAQNIVRSGVGQGIAMRSGTFDNVLRDNDARNNAGDDCVDETDPAANTWTDNLGAEQVGTAVCSLP